MTKITLLILSLVIGGRLVGQSLIRFDSSDCLKDCVGDSSKVYRVEKSGLLTIISLKTYAPCNGNLTGDVEIINSFLNLKFWTKSAIVTDIKGRKTEIVEVADCNCMFDFKYQIQDLRALELKEIIVNGKTLKEIDSKNILAEIKIE